MRRALVPLLLAAAVSPLAAQQTVNLPGRDRTLAGVPATLLTFGREEGESWQMLSNVSGVDFDARDNLYILDAGNHRVLVLDPAGKLVRSFGKRGGGPGELLSPLALAVLGDGSVAVADLGRGAFSIFGPDGAFRHNVPFADTLGHPMPEQRGSQPSVHAHPAGLAVMGALRVFAGPDGPPSSPPADLPLYIRPLAEKAAARPVYRIPRDPPVTRTSGTQANRNVRSMARGFAPQTGWGVLPGGGFAVLHGNSPAYRVHVLDANGRVQRTIGRPLQPRRVTRADQERARELAAERMRTGTGMVRMQVTAGAGGAVQRSISAGGRGSDGPSEQDIQAQVRDMEFADVVPVVSGIRTDPQGRIWVARAPARVGDDGAIDLLGADGRYIGTTSPQPLPDAISRTGLAAYITLNDLGVEQVVLKRLPRGWQ